jgi:hypothetical protein
MLLLRPAGNPDSPLTESGGEVNRDNCECSCEFDHCRDSCETCIRRRRYYDGERCDTCTFGECGCQDDCSCDYCTCEPENGEEGLHPASTDVLRIFGAEVDSNEPGAVLLGAEVELHIPDGDTQDAVDGLRAAFAASPSFIGKEDGSIGNGIEMVTLPLTLEQHGDLGKALAAHWFRTMEKTASCGMHVHIGRASFDTENHQDRFAEFFGLHGGNPDWNLFLDRLFRRASNGFCRRETKGDDMRREGKYAAVNFSKRNTLEVRGFWTCQSLSVYMANLELVLAVRNATAKGYSRIHASSPTAFMAWVASNAATYPHLAKRLTLRHGDSGSELFAPWLPGHGTEERPNLYGISGPNVPRVHAFLRAFRAGTIQEREASAGVWTEPLSAAKNRAFIAARAAGRVGEWNQAWENANCAACPIIALVADDLISRAEFTLLTSAYDAFMPEVAPCV